MHSTWPRQGEREIEALREQQLVLNALVRMWQGLELLGLRCFLCLYFPSGGDQGLLTHVPHLAGWLDAQLLAEATCSLTGYFRLSQERLTESPCVGH